LSASSALVFPAPVVLANISSWRKVAREATGVRGLGKSGESQYAYRYLAHRFSEARMGAGLR
jgi:hypothetical protein